LHTRWRVHKLCTTNDLMSRKPQNRVLLSETIDTLIDELSLIFSGIEKVSVEDYDQLRHTDDPPSAETQERTFVAWNEPSNLLFVFLWSPSQADEAPPLKAISLRTAQKPQAYDLKFANKYLRVFHSDMEAAPSTLEDDEHWNVLTLSRPVRAISRTASFNTSALLRCIFLMESAFHLKYEGEDFYASVVLKQHWKRDDTNSQYIWLKEPMPFSAIIHEKWLRAISCQEGIGLISNLHSVLAVASLPGGPVDTVDGGNLLLPSELRRIKVAMQVHGTRALVRSKNGDFFFVNPNASFVMTQGRWHYRNYRYFSSLLAENLEAKISAYILQLIVDLSHGRHGALICVPFNATDIKKLVADHELAGRANQALRQTASLLRIEDESHRKILHAAAGIDGAIIISTSGAVLDVACMIQNREDSEITALGVRRVVFPGARSNAAWNASLSGIAIKVSEDGPVTFFRKGQLVAQIG